VAYFLEALLVAADQIGPEDPPFGSVPCVRLAPRLLLLPLTDEVLASAKTAEPISRVNHVASESLPAGLEAWVRAASKQAPIAYVAAEYFGGVGGQFSIVWSEGEVRLGPLREPDAINRALRLLGVKSAEGNDEFDTVGLGRHRQTHQWK
jgi:hypothetical protein